MVCSLSKNLPLDVLSFHIPTALLAILFFIIVVRLKSKKIPGEKTANAEEQRAKANRNVFKMSVAIVCTLLGSL